MLLLLMTLMMQDLIEEAKALGEPYTVWKCIKDLLIICLLMSIEFFIFIGSGIILHTPNIQQGEAWVKPTIYGLTFIVMCAVSVGYTIVVNRVELIIKERRRKCSVN